MKIYIQQPALPAYRIPFFQEWAQREGAEVTLFYSSKSRSLENKPPSGFVGIHVPMLQFRIGNRKLMWHSAQWRGAARNVCDVLVLSWDAQYLSLVPALLRARKNGIKTIIWGHGYSKHEAAVRKRIRDGVARLADALVFYDRTTAQKYLDGGWPQHKIHVAPNALDQNRIQAARKLWERDPGRLKSFRLANELEGRLNLIYIGRIYSENRVDVLIKALPSIRQSCPRVQLLVIGEGEAIVTELKQLAMRLKVNDIIQWIGAVYDEEDIAPYMLSAKLCCYPANVGLSIMHAMGYGLPVVTGDHIPSHNPEVHVLRDGKNGRLFRHLDADDLALQVSALLDHQELLEGMGTDATRTVLESYTVPKMVDGFMDAVTSLLKGDPR